MNKPPSLINGKRNPAYHKWWKKNNKKKVREYHAQWQTVNPKAVATYNKKWKKNNPDLVMAQNKRGNAARKLKAKTNRKNAYTLWHIMPYNLI